MLSSSISVDVPTRAGKKVMRAGQQLTGTVTASGLDDSEWYAIVEKEFDNPDASAVVDKIPIGNGSASFTDQFNYSEDVEYQVSISDNMDKSTYFSRASTGNIFPLNEIAERGRDFIDRGSKDSQSSNTTETEAGISVGSSVIQKIKDNKIKVLLAAGISLFSLLSKR